ncbi:hypothetical protein ABTY59_32060 [Streptomyces sp. NPDC096079]|uniref:hypothetical protein n=1 Tax=Streptomyces sp. NPDC096079 TaxID=3155820 RepID=UPI00332A9B60
MGIADTSIAAAAALFSGISAFASWKTAQRAHGTAESVAQIERDRWHTELTPQFAARIVGQDGRLEGLDVRFNGPVGLGRLDAVRLTIRNDRDRSNDPVLGAGPTAEQRAEVIFGPFRFRPGTDDADPLGRTLGPFTLDVHDEHRLALDPSLAPFWYEGAEGAQRWRHDHPDSENLRLWIDCEAKGHKPWKLSVEVGWTGNWVQAG